LFRNNIGIGAPGPGRRGRDYLAANFPGADETCDFDYDGYGVIGGPFKGNIGGNVFDSLQSLRMQTSERHGVQVGLDIFAADVVMPDPLLKEWDPPDLRLRPGAAAVDAGAIIPNVTDGYTGAAPDLGAYELGQDLPVYGPRPE
jgi:hypothetical protein